MKNLPETIALMGDCRKMGATIYIDDRSIFFQWLGRVDWEFIKPILLQRVNEE